jgi:hypothetical protein
MAINTTETVRNSYIDVSDETLFRQMNDAGDAIKKEPRVKVFIYGDPTKEIQDPVPLGINGYNFLIPRDKEIMVPYSVYAVLQQQRIIR